MSERYSSYKRNLKTTVISCIQTGKDNWEDIYAGYKEKLDNADISKCESIIYSYDEHIVTDLEIYSEEPTALWYVDSWQGSMFIEVLDWIIKKIEVKGTFDQNFLRKLFLRPFVDFIKQQEGGSLPTALLAYLDETERVGIDIDENVNAKVFSEDVTDINSLPEDVKHQAGIGMEQRQNQSNQESEETVEEDLDTSYTQPVDNGRPTTERKRRSDLHGTHQRRELSTHEKVTDEPHPTSSYSSDSDREKPQAEERKSFTDRLKEKWNEQKMLLYKSHMVQNILRMLIFSIRLVVHLLLKVKRSFLMKTSILFNTLRM